jgi:uncharacterized membrane protein
VTWASLHPAGSHFPITLLIVASIVSAIGLFLQEQAGTLHAVALGLLVAGTVFMCAAASTGGDAWDV